MTCVVFTDMIDACDPAGVQNEKRLAHEKAEQEAEEKQKHRAAMEKERKKRNKLFLKKTKRGQPVMKHRIDKVLEKLQAEQG